MKSYCLLPAFLLVGCATQVPPPTVVGVGSDPLPQKQDVPDTASVRSPETLKAYPVGRSVDPDDPNVMHEGHTIYRAETSSDWNTAPNAPTSLPLGPDQVATAQPAQQHTALTAELEQRLKQEDQLLQTTYEQNERLSQEIKALQQSVPHLRPPDPDTEALPPPSAATSEPKPPAIAPHPSPPPQKKESDSATPKPWWNWIWSQPHPQPLTTQKIK